MGFCVNIEGLKTEISNYSVEEASSPLAAGDSSGQVGTFSISLPIPDGYVPLQGYTSGFGYGEGPYGSGPYGGASVTETPNTPWKIMRLLGPQILIDRSVRLEDSRKGFTLGTITDCQENRASGTLELRGVSRLGTLNVYGIQAQPFVGTLRNAFSYYLGLAGISTDLFVDDSIGGRQVVFPGWTGELWYHLKLMATAQDCDISLVSGVVLLRPIRNRTATQDRDIDRTVATGANTLAQAIEIYQYNNRSITNELVYPPGGWNSEVEVLNVNAGETAEYTLELSSSLSSIQTPVMQTFVGETYNSSSVYTIVANDGRPVLPAQWAAYGGSLTVEIMPDTTHLRVVLRGATGLPTTEGKAAQNFSVALGSDTTGNRYSTLRIVGTGVAYEKVKKRVRTGVPASKTSTEVGVTIDNPFISTVNDLYRAGTRAAKQYAGVSMSLSGSVIAINRRGDSGVLVVGRYDQVESALKSAIGPTATYGQVKDYYTSLDLISYEQVRQYWIKQFEDENANQVFGNAQGARIYDRRTRRWYRIRSATLTPAEITFSADDDHTMSDVQELYGDLTYAGVQTILEPFTYREAELAGLWRP
ncbi:minor tail protein [Microbacterium phage WaterT]|nr:minor tail protein [Microbacterium phage WaterT]